MHNSDSELKKWTFGIDNIYLKIYFLRTNNIEKIEAKKSDHEYEVEQFLLPLSRGLEKVVL